MGVCNSKSESAVSVKKTITEEDRTRIDAIINFWYPYPNWDRDTSVKNGAGRFWFASG